MTEAYRRYIADTGKEENGRKIDDAPGQWKRDCDRYQWRSRHTAFWRDHHQKNLDWIESERQKLAALELATAQVMMQRAMQILALPIDPERVSPKDAATLARAASELGRLALSWDNLDRAIDIVTRQGFVVSINPEIRGILNDEKISALFESRGNGDVRQPN
ncbi:hypothetical protein [Synechocystis salina]|uniref:Uncharacterized protein n=1 Tax=Synechocystis salina LEGE 00031 TaxID=1828736 RepID=A0ABR9VW55_9SYNC|nr:hypothetical protein [Synechocystis salina]MBE9242529.1 hypothetical protein [Synechocystis salina LEGE 00041]MBE9255599.1 hypothetical protein [Synechocystis salina LEGE 00031]